MSLKEVVKNHPELEFYYIKVQSKAYRGHVEDKTVYVNEFNVDVNSIKELIGLIK